MSDLSKLKHPRVRDLAYSCFSEPLVTDFSGIAGFDAPSHCSLTLTEKRLSWLRRLDRDPQTLINYLEPFRFRKLGLYHEALWHFFLQQDDDVELLGNNLQVMEAGKTIGEFDVVYLDLARGIHAHLELAFKIYLQSDAHNSNPLSQWLGPNVRDRFDLKLQHMLDHQCRLSATTAGKDRLQSLGIREVDKQISLRGYLFHREIRTPPNQADAPLNPDHQTGAWLPLGRLEPWLKSTRQWAILPSVNWISPPMPGGTEGSYSSTQLGDFLQNHFARRRSPVMVDAFDHGPGTKPGDAFRLMVTPDDWPG